MGNSVNELPLKMEILSLRLVKWDGDPPEGDPDPIGHPKCAEVLEINMQTGERRELYRRDENASVQ
jgi:hypothetical protein